MPPVDFYYDVGLSSYPPAPAPLDVVASTLPSPRSTEDGVVVSVKDFRDYIPPYFVPVEALLQCMPGYTLQHLQEYLDTHAVELVRVGESRFIRLHGGFGKIPIHREDGADVEESLKPYQPDPSLVTAFEVVFQGNTDQWMPLEELLGKADPKAVAALPYEGEFAILYFAQMQHKFNFSVSPTSGSAVKLRPVPVRGLTELTTPTPTSLSFFFFTIPTDEQISTEKLKALTPADVASEINLYYGTLESFFAMHGPIFYISEDCSIVMRTSYRRRLQFASLTLEQQLQVAMEKKDKPKIRTIRRRIAFRDNPSHPFHDPDNLAMEVAKYLPRKGHVLMKMFMRHLPEDVINFLPSRHYAFFKGYPQYFQIFEYHKAGTWALSRPGLPLPKGVIRQQFDENDLLRLTAEQLQARGGKASCSTVIVNLPQGAQELVRKRHGGLYYFFEKHPDHFRLVLPSDASNTVSAAVAHLIKVPSTLSVEDEGGDEPK
ncbi:hypothetical protein AGDE_10475 [Angomonas deanei]|nr:hypothetical protein AGDE_10475 [Angomonas deanei]|eukprot:EPY28251.1 hypothetical protein AGDE_10475 [Angomonas deanei]